MSYEPQPEFWAPRGSQHLYRLQSGRTVEGRTVPLLANRYSTDVY